MTPSRLRVALVIGSSTGGIGQHVRSLAACLVHDGHRVVVIAPAATLTLFDMAGTGAGVHPLAVPSSRPSDIGRLRAAVLGADVVHAHGLRAAAAVGSVTRRGRPPLVVTWHNAVLGPRWRQRLLTPLERYVARRADRTLAASSDLAARAIELGGRAVTELPVAAPEPAPAERARWVRAALDADGRGLVVTVARLHPQKRLDVLVDAAARLAGHPRQPLFVVAGEGPSRSDLERRIARLAAPVRLLGQRSDADALIAAADVVALPSAWEARSLVAQQALRSARPLVTTPVGGLPDLVGDAAVLVPVGDAAALSDAVAALLDDAASAEQLAARAGARGRALPTVGDMAASVLAAYREVLP